MSEVVYEQLPGLHRRYTPERGEFTGYAMFSIRLKLLTWKKKRLRKRWEQFDTEITPQENYSVESLTSSVDDAELVQLALAQLSDYERWLVLARIVDEMNFEDMAAKLEVAKGTAFNHYERAFITFRETLRNLSK